MTETKTDVHYTLTTNGTTTRFETEAEAVTAYNTEVANGNDADLNRVWTETAERGGTFSNLLRFTVNGWSSPTTEESD